MASNAVGVPLTSPLVVLKDKPVGSAGLTAKLTVPKPPEAVTGVKGVATLFAVKLVAGTACTVVRATGLTMSWKVFDDVCAAGVALSVAVTVKVAVANNTVGVPLTSPLVVLKDKPVGSAGLTAKLTVPKPPEAVTGVKGVAALFAVKLVAATAWAVVSVAGLTVSWKVFEEVCGVGVVLSVAVTVKVAVANNAEGVPLT